MVITLDLNIVDDNEEIQEAYNQEEDLSEIFYSLLSCKLSTIGVFRFSGNKDLIIIYTPAKYTYFIFSLILSFFILLNVSFIVSFVNKLSFIFPFALLIVILLSIF